MDFKKKKMKRKGEWHSAWGSAVQHRRCERGHNQGSKSLQGAHPFSLDLCRHPPTLRMHTNLLARGRALPSYTCALPSDDQCQKKKKKKIVLKGLWERIGGLDKVHIMPRKSWRTCAVRRHLTSLRSARRIFLHCAAYTVKYAALSEWISLARVIF